MNGSLETFFILALFGVLMLLAMFWNGSRSQIRNAFGANQVEPAGEFSELAVFRLHCGEDGPKVGIRFPIAMQGSEHAVLDAAEAIKLAHLLETAAGDPRAP